MTYNWSPQQSDAIEKVRAWYKAGGDQWFYLAGFAGTGKTTLAQHLVDETGAKPCYGAYTGKAAAVMNASGCKGAGTLHSKAYIYKMRRDGTVRKLLNKAATSPIKKADILVVDECSMVDGEMGKDLLSFGKPILVLGDPAQLPPVQGEGFFTSRDPDVMLTEIHRQAEGNPIIQLATLARSGKQIEFGIYGDSHVVTASEFRDGHDITKADQVLVGKRVTRAAYNTRLREIAGKESAFPVPGDQLICRKNDRDHQIFNGQMFEVLGLHDATYEHPNMLGMTVKDDDGRTLSVMVRREFFTNERTPDWKDLNGTQSFEFGYALTVHMSQGSQWDRVIVRDEAFGSEDDKRRWRYTAITRAAKAITIIR